jgi:signal transduction histidine kinase
VLDLLLPGIDGLSVCRQIRALDGPPMIMLTARDTLDDKVAGLDSGPGIAAGDLAHIFERFFRLDRARSRRRGGAGLGLAITRWIAEAHEGRIEVESVVGQGSVFTLVLPIL